MALNWSSFLTDEGLNAQNERWDSPRAASDRQHQSHQSHQQQLQHHQQQRQQFQQQQQQQQQRQHQHQQQHHQQLPHHHQRPQHVAPTTTAPSGQGSITAHGLPQGPPDFSPFIENPGQDSYFSDAFYNGPGDYFLSDLEVLEPLGAVTLAGGSTSDSSPEHSQAGPPSPHPALRSRPFVEDLTFPQGPPASGSRNTLETVPEFQETDLTTKRTKNDSGRTDAVSACWTSPLCPNHSKEGTPPNPSTCGGGCAPFLFSNDDPLMNSALDSSLMSNNASKEPTPDGVVEIRSRLKRSESESNSEAPSGRVFRKSISVAESSNLKHESSPESIDDAPIQTIEDTKGKPRRRLPHNQVERKYRESLNTQLDSLRRVVPALQQGGRGCDSADIEDLPTPSKPSKAVILASATAYIKQMEKDKKQLADENQLLRTRIKALQALVKCEDCSLMQYVMDLKIHNPT
ncbi:uncharacterized protein K452DRAFT_327828 [Aplosporella prunicola CBS 121167]|uniref:BHLH domain-containing protein n=1 Tax=Aplosporella prunicola CBS 121167 TaxID=1176127 RepID=A0A6A6BBN2_9PEZI|nr:uncharacterized protein K452DRAFT_327828 [Aplosporella prunicola CBS 121167]KAF2139891.1 hypothetical protein K452DRAFT_327828 [Aplosporella prunicola CBS 121167]